MDHDNSGPRPPVTAPMDIILMALGVIAGSLGWILDSFLSGIVLLGIFLAILTLTVLYRVHYFLLMSIEFSATKFKELKKTL